MALRDQAATQALAGALVVALGAGQVEGADARRVEALTLGGGLVQFGPTRRLQRQAT
jgi:hypothetical protein